MFDGRAHHQADGAKFIVDRNADGLKTPFGRMLFFAQRLVRHRGLDDFHQFQRRLDWPVSPYTVDGSGDLRRVPLLAVFI